MAQARDQFRDLVRRKLSTLAGLRTLRDLDLDLFRIGQVLRGHAESSGGELLDLVVAQAASAGQRIRLPGDGIFTALAGVRARAEDVHRLRDGAVCLRA